MMVPTFEQVHSNDGQFSDAESYYNDGSADQGASGNPSLKASTSASTTERSLFSDDLATKAAEYHPEDTTTSDKPQEAVLSPRSAWMMGCLMTECKTDSVKVAQDLVTQSQDDRAQLASLESMAHCILQQVVQCKSVKAATTRAKRCVADFVSPYQDNFDTEQNEPAFQVLDSLLEPDASDGGRINTRTTLLFGATFGERMVNARSQIQALGILYHPQWKLRYELPSDLMFLCLDKQKLVRADFESLHNMAQELDLFELLPELLEDWGMDTRESFRELYFHTKEDGWRPCTIPDMHCWIFVCRAYRCMQALQCTSIRGSLAKKVSRCLALLQDHAEKAEEASTLPPSTLRSSKLRSYTSQRSKMPRRVSNLASDKEEVATPTVASFLQSESFHDSRSSAMAEATTRQDASEYCPLDGSSPPMENLPLGANRREDDRKSEVPSMRRQEDVDAIGEYEEYTTQNGSSALTTSSSDEEFEFQWSPVAGSLAVDDLISLASAERSDAESDYLDFVENDNHAKRRPKSRPRTVSLSVVAGRQLSNDHPNDHDGRAGAPCSIVEDKDSIEYKCRLLNLSEVLALPVEKVCPYSGVVLHTFATGEAALRSVTNSNYKWHFYLALFGKTRHSARAPQAVYLGYFWRLKGSCRMPPKTSRPCLMVNACTPKVKAIPKSSSLLQPHKAVPMSAGPPTADHIQDATRGYSLGGTTSDPNDSIEEKCIHMERRELLRMAVEQLCPSTGKVVGTFDNYISAHKSISTDRHHGNFKHTVQGLRTHRSIPHYFKRWFWRFQGSRRTPENFHKKNSPLITATNNSVPCSSTTSLQSSSTHHPNATSFSTNDNSRSNNSAASTSMGKKGVPTPNPEQMQTTFEKPSLPNSMLTFVIPKKNRKRSNDASILCSPLSKKRKFEILHNDENARDNAN